MSSIKYFGHATVLLTTESGKKIIIDPFLEGNPLCPDDCKELDSLDMIVLTHGHADHASSAAPLAKKHGATIFATYELASLMAKEGVPEYQIQFMNKGGTVEQDGIKVSLTNAYHSSSFDASDGVTYYAGEACGAVVTLESGKSIYHAGDTCLFDDMKLIAKEYTPEVALLPIGDRFTMGPKEAAEAAKLIKPKKAIPIHFGTFELLTGTPSEFASYLEGSGIEVLTLEPGQESN